MVQYFQACTWWVQLRLTVILEMFVFLILILPKSFEPVFHKAENKVEGQKASRPNLQPVLKTCNFIQNRLLQHRRFL